MNTAKFVYCCDADITQTCLKLVPNAKIITHTKKHNEGVKASEVFDKNAFVKEVAKNDRFILCCDSAIEAKKFKEELTKLCDEREILLITADTEEKIMKDLNLDKFPRIIYSPKIIYGLDSSMERAVFAYYTKKTITSASMVQQVCRCRKITELVFMFANQNIKHPKYKSKADCLTEIKKQTNIANEISALSRANSMEANLYKEILCDTKYVNDCDSTNKRLHFINRLLKKGFVLTQEFDKVSNLDKVKEKSLKDEVEAQESANIIEMVTLSPKHVRRNSILHIPKPRILEFQEIFLNDKLAKEHFQYCDLIIKNNAKSTKSKMIDQYSYLTDFHPNVAISDANKINFVRDFIDQTGTTIKDLLPTTGVKKDVAKKMYENYRTIFEVTFWPKKIPDLTKVDDCELYLFKMLRKIVNTSVYRRDETRVMKNGVSRKKIEIDEEKRLFHETIYEFRKPNEDLVQDGKMLVRIDEGKDDPLTHLGKKS